MHELGNVNLISVLRGTIVELLDIYNVCHDRVHFLSQEPNTLASWKVDEGSLAGDVEVYARCLLDGQIICNDRVVLDHVVNAVARVLDTIRGALSKRADLSRKNVGSDGLKKVGLVLVAVDCQRDFHEAF
jgi:hypothetical protein